MAQEPSAIWPALPYSAWRDTYSTLHLWTQIVGKVRLACAPPLNHWWQIPLYVSPRGLTTGNVPYGERSFSVEFDFVEHVLRITVSSGEIGAFKLEPMTVAEFYARFLKALRKVDLDVKIWPVPVERPDAIPFAEDHEHAAYDAEYANRLWRVLLQCDRVFTEFRGRFLGKSSPVHFFWGAFDLAVTRFSGRTAPPHPGGMPHVGVHVMREAYSHEVSSAGFWPGTPELDAAFYSYAYPGPEGFDKRVVQPKEAYFHAQMGEFILPYEAVRTAADPDAMLMAFLQSTYEAAADSAHWDRAALERLTAETGR